MAVKVCPECRHEIAGRGRYCMFCGCDLRKSRPVAAPAEQAGNRAAESREAAEGGNRKTSGILKVVVLAVLVIAAALAGYTLLANVAGPFTNPDTPALRAGMSLSEAALAVEKCGFVKDGAYTEKNGKYTQRYKSRQVYGYDTRYSVLEVEPGKNGRVSLSNYYMNSGIEAADSWKYVQLAKRMQQLYGVPKQLKGVTEGYSWSEENGGHLLYSVAGMMVATQWQSE